MVKTSSGQGPGSGLTTPGPSATRTSRNFSVRQQPGWAKGLQRLYDDVVEEALPPEFADLLSQLDKISDGD